MKGFTQNLEKQNSGFEAYKEILASVVDEDVLEEVQIVDDYHATLQEDKVRVFWCHDVPNNPETHVFADRDWVNKFHKIVFTSYWQMQNFQETYNLPHDLKCVVIENGFNPAPESALNKSKDNIDIVYIGLPERGLDIVVPVFNFFSKENEKLRLHIFSPEILDKEYDDVFDRLKQNDKITLHCQFTRNDFLNILTSSHIYVLPSDYKQISGRALLEAMSAGNICVHPNTNNLPEITGCLNIMYHSDMSDSKMHAGIFAGNLNAAIDLIDKNHEQNLLRFNKAYVDNRYGITFIKSKWNAILKRLLEEYPDPVARKYKQDTFLYSKENNGLLL